MGHLAQDCPKVPTASVNQVTPNPTTARNPNQQGTNTSQGGGRG